MANLRPLPWVLRTAQNDGQGKLRVSSSRPFASFAVSSLDKKCAGRNDRRIEAVSKTIREKAYFPASAFILARLRASTSRTIWSTEKLAGSWLGG